MDQLRTALSWLQRYHFWVLSVIVAAIAVGCWYSAAGALAAKFQANRATIEREFTSQKSLANGAFHANEDINTRQEEEIQKQAESVRRTWDTLYKRQRDEVLRWPDELDKTFHDGVESLKFEEEIPTGLREQYFNYIKNHFSKLPEKVGARAMAVGERATRGGRESFGPWMPGQPGEQEADDDNYLVEWPDQGRVRQELQQWSQTPTSLQIWVVQEDLWVYHTLLQIIADTNKGAELRSNVAVRVIESLEVGQAAAQASASTSGRIFVPQGATSGPGLHGGEEFRESGAEMMPSSGVGEGPSAFGGTAPAEGGGGDDRARLLSSRYLDKDGKPIAVAGASTGPTEFGVEFKRLPVLMVLEMDQRKIPQLIANCTNQPLQVEVQQVRIHPLGTRSAGSRRPNVDGRTGDAETFESQPNIARVIIHGIIYIINQPDAATLQIAGT